MRMYLCVFICLYVAENLRYMRNKRGLWKRFVSTPLISLFCRHWLRGIKYIFMFIKHVEWWRKLLAEGSERRKFTYLFCHSEAPMFSLFLRLLFLLYLSLFCPSDYTATQRTRERNTKKKINKSVKSSILYAFFFSRIFIFSTPLVFSRCTDPRIPFGYAAYNRCLREPIFF